MHQQTHLVLDALLDWQPMQSFQSCGHVVIRFEFIDKTSGGVENALKRSNRRGRKTNVAIIES
jgi:hypothetical protein